MRIAVFSDVHGNLAALDAVLMDAQEQGATYFWCLGDLVAYGPRPVESVQRLRTLRNLRCVSGNTDRYVLTGHAAGMIPAIDHPQSAEDYAALCDARESFAWTRGCLVGGDQYEWVKAVPMEQRVVLPDGTRVLLVHASPGRDDGWGLRPDWSDDALEEAGFTGTVADLILVGHTHLASDRRIAGTHAVNPGSVSLPRTPDDRTRWALLEATRDGYTVEHRAVKYDLGRVIADLDRQAHPSSAWLAAKMTGRE